MTMTPPASPSLPHPPFPLPPGDSRLYAYAIVRPDRAAPPPGVTGIGGTPVALLPAGPFAVIAGPAPEGEVRRTRRNLLAHVKVLEAALGHGPLLPMRFGVVAAGREALAAHVGRHADALAALLERHDGVAEFGLRITFPREAAMAALAARRPDFAATRARLLREGAGRLAYADLGRAVAEALDDARKTAERALMALLRPLARDAVLRAPESDVEVLRAEFLLPLGAEDAFAATAAERAAALPFGGGAVPELRLVGPVPAYSFVSLALDAPVAA